MKCEKHSMDRGEKMKNTKISVVVPIYNVMQYLDECLTSIVNQTYKNLEIILVNDGSTDDSEIICKKYVEEDKRFKYLYQANAGASAARKKGVQYATGEYVSFVDADDYLELDMFEKMYVELQSTLKKHPQLEKVDMIVGQIVKGYQKEEKMCGYIPTGAYTQNAEIEYIVDNMIAYNMQKMYGVLPCMCSKLYNLVTLEKVMNEVSEEVFYGEDAECTYRYLLRCNSVVVTDICGYHYRMRDDSAVHSVNKGYLRNVDALYNSLESTFRLHKQADSLLCQLDIWISSMISQSAFFMGFHKSAGQISYLYPRMDLIVQKRIVLYGAGKVGHSYYTLFTKTNCCEIVCWVDKKSDVEKGIDSVDKIATAEYDYVLLAVKSKALAEEITESLIEKSICPEKIIWDEPIE